MLRRFRSIRSFVDINDGYDFAVYMLKYLPATFVLTYVLSVLSGDRLTGAAGLWTAPIVVAVGVELRAALRRRRLKLSRSSPPAAGSSATLFPDT